MKIVILGAGYAGVRAARRLLRDDGYAAITLEGVALEAGEDRATITRHFGSKAGLVNALFDALGEDIFAQLTARAAAVPAGERRRHVFIRSLGDLATDRELTLGMYELMPHVLRDPTLRQRLGALYAYYRKLMLTQADMGESLETTQPYHDRKDVEALPALVMAVIDGMSIQQSLDASSIDCERVFALLDLFVSAVLDGRIRTGGRLGESGID